MIHLVLGASTVAELLRDIFEQLDPLWFPTFTDINDVGPFFEAMVAGFKVCLSTLASAVKDVLSLRFLYGWVHLPGMFPPQYSPVLNALNYYVLDAGQGGIGQNLWTGFGNGLFLTFPTSPAQLYAVASLFIWGVPSAVFALAGCIVGQLLGFVPILFGWEKLFLLWQGNGYVPILLNMGCTAYLSAHLYTTLPSLYSVAWYQKRLLSQRFWLCVFGSLVNMGSILPNFENLSSSLGGTEYQAGDHVVPFLYDINMLLYFFGLALGLVFWGFNYGVALYAVRYVTLYNQKPVAKAAGLLRDAPTLGSIFFWIQSSCAVLMSLGTVYAITWAGTDAITYSGLGFMYKDRAIPELKRPGNMFHTRVWTKELSEPETIDFPDEDWDVLLDDWVMWYPYKYDLFPYNDDFCLNDPLNQWHDETAVDEFWTNYDPAGRFFSDEDEENQFIRELRLVTENMASALMFSLNIEREESKNEVDFFGNEVRKDRRHAVLDQSPDLDRTKLFYNDYFVPRLNRENVHDFADAHSFLSEVMRGIFRYDTTVTQLDRDSVEELEDEDLEVVNTKDWRERYRNNFFYKIVHPSTYWAKTKFRSHARHQLNVNQSYDVASRRGMLMNYLDFVNRWHTDEDDSVSLSPRSMPNRAYNHQFRGNIQLVASWECLDVNYGSRYELNRNKYRPYPYEHNARSLGFGTSPPWYDIPQRLHKPWYKDYRDRKIRPYAPQDYRLVPSMLETSSVATFDLPTWNSYPMEAKHALHEELWHQVEEDMQADEEDFKPFEGFREIEGVEEMDDQDDSLRAVGSAHYAGASQSNTGAKPKGKKSAFARRESRFGAPRGWPPDGPLKYGEKVAAIEEWFLPNQKHRQATLDHFQRRNIDPAPMYIGWDENRQKMLVRQSHVPNFIHTMAPVSAPRLETSSEDTRSQELDVETSQTTQRKRRKPTWFQFAAWAPNGLHIPSKAPFYRTYELNATTMELQRLSSAYDMVNPLKAFDIDTKSTKRKPGDNLTYNSEMRKTDTAYMQEILDEAKENWKSGGILDEGMAEDPDFDPETWVQNQDFQVLRLYRLRKKKLSRSFGDTDVVGWANPGPSGFTGSWDLLERLPQSDFVPLFEELEDAYFDEREKHLLQDYASIGYLLPPGIGGFAWPGSYDVRILPDGMRDKIYDSFYYAAWNDNVSKSVTYVLDSKAFDMRGIVNTFDLGVFHRRWEDDLHYFEKAQEEKENWHLAPAEFERLYERYHHAKHGKAKHRPSPGHTPETASSQKDPQSFVQTLDEEESESTSDVTTLEKEATSEPDAKTSSTQDKPSMATRDKPDEA